MRIVFLFLLVGFSALASCDGCEESRSKRDLLIRTKRRWVLSTIEIDEEMKGDYPQFVSKMYNDKTQGKEFRFEISGLAVNLNYLTIDEKTGEVFVHKPIDREEYPCFHVIFDVYDTETNQKIDKELAFDVDVKDINDNPPTFMKIPKDFLVNESQPEGLLGVEVIGQDLDEKNSVNSTFNITVIKQDPLEPKIQAKWIDERIVHLNFTGCFDYDKAKQYQITLEAKDHGTPPLSSTAVITVNVGDTNTNMPVFKKREFQAEVHEMDLIPELFRFKVDDKDTPNTDGWRAKFFFISGNQKGNFKVETDPKTNEGVLSIVKKTNYDNTTLVELVIGVENIEPFTKCQNGKLIKNDSKLYADRIVVKVTMLDDNDPPEFHPPKAKVYENEESEPGRVIFTPKVVDPDSTSPFSVSRFQLVEDPADWVSVDENTGEIKTTKKMDRESPFVDENDIYKIVIAAIDDVLLLIFFCDSGEKQLKDMTDEGTQTLIKYNQEGGGSACNAEPVYPTSTTAHDGIMQSNVMLKSNIPSEYHFNEEMYKSKNNMTISMNSHHQRDSYRSQEGRSMFSSMASNRMSSYRVSIAL
ncbi:Cadherin-like protein 26 [Oryzias melastigma]|uniref:Cadherin-like protein 26 n=1 Tax=Oryzias melastigma TaxID=30732 RepID=A0A834F1U3_ORYME|nr:Cadherin-like protein 26 [Oryzias melastigma]